MGFGQLGVIGGGSSGSGSVAVSSETYIESSSIDASTLGITVTTSATVNTKGSWVELIASTSADYTFIELVLSDVSTVERQFAVDIGVGAAASESAVISNLTCAFAGAPLVDFNVRIPIAIAAGSRISIRAQCGTAGAHTLTAQLSGYGGGHAGEIAPTSVTALVALTGSSTVLVDPGASANTFGSWTELVASTSADYDGIIICTNDRAGSGSGEARRQVQIATGATSSEVVIFDKYHMKDGFNMFTSQYYGPYYLSIPSGTRLSARAKCDSTTANDRALYVNIMGFSSP